MCFPKERVRQCCLHPARLYVSSVPRTQTLLSGICLSPTVNVSALAPAALTTGMTNQVHLTPSPVEPGGVMLLLPLALPFHRAVGDPPTPREARLSWSDRNPQLSRPVRFHDGVKGGMNKLKQPTACQEIRIEQLPVEPLAKFSSLQPLGAISDGAQFKDSFSRRVRKDTLL